jgi:gliding motility-associated-like protein
LGGKYYWYFNGTPLEITNTPSFSIANATVSNSGDYSVAFSISGCNSQQSAPETVTVNSLLAETPVLAAQQATLCEGATIQLSSAAISGASYEWFYNGGNGPVSLGTTQSPIFTINNATPTNSGLYTVQANVSGCVSNPSNGQNIQVLDQMGTAPILSVSSSVLCEGADLTLNASALPGSGVSYEWFFNNGSGQVSLGSTTTPTLQLNGLGTDASGLYSVVATNGLCETPLSNAVSVAIGSNIGPALTLTVDNDVICEGGLLELNSSIFPSFNVSYNWYFDNGTTTVLLGTTNLPTFFVQNMTDANEGIYTVTASVGNCETQPSNAQDIYVTNALAGAPTLTASATQLCTGATLALNSSIYPGTSVQYIWYFNNGTATTLLATTDVPTYFVNNATAANAGVYSVVVASGNCTTQPSNTAQVSVSNLAGQALQLAVSDDKLCKGETLTLNSSSAGPNMQYQWYFDNGNGAVLLGTTDVPTYFIENMAAANVGTYSVIAGNGFCSTPSSNLQAVSLVQAPALSADASTDADSPACRGELVQLNVTQVAGATYQWNGPQGFTASTPNPVLPSATTGQAGAYIATLTIDGCSFQAPAANVHVYTGIVAADDLFDVQFNLPLTEAVLTANDQTGNVQYWDIHIAEQPTNGTAKLVDGKLEYVPNHNYYGQDALVYEICNTDCPDDCATATVRLNVLGSQVEAPCFVPNIITPNGDGRNDFFTVPCLETTYTNNNVRIFNRWGDKVYEKDGYLNDWDSSYKGNLLPPGTYFYLIQLDKQHSDEVMQGYFTITR